MTLGSRPTPLSCERLTAFWTAPHVPKPSMSLSDQRGVVEFSVHQLRRLSLVVLCNAHEVDHDVPGVEDYSRATTTATTTHGRGVYVCQGV